MSKTRRATTTLGVFDYDYPWRGRGPGACANARRRARPDPVFAGGPRPRRHGRGCSRRHRAGAAVVLAACFPGRAARSRDTLDLTHSIRGSLPRSFRLAMGRPTASNHAPPPLVGHVHLAASREPRRGRRCRRQCTSQHPSRADWASRWFDDCRGSRGAAANQRRSSEDKLTVGCAKVSWYVRLLRAWPACRTARSRPRRAAWSSCQLRVPSVRAIQSKFKSQLERCPGEAVLSS